MFAIDVACFFKSEVDCDSLVAVAVAVVSPLAFCFPNVNVKSIFLSAFVSSVRTFSIAYSAGLNPMGADTLAKIVSIEF